MCRQWRRLFYQQPSLWRSLEVCLPNEAHAARAGFPHKLALLRRVAPLLEEASMVGASLDAVGNLAGVSGGLAAFLEALQAATALTSLQLEQPFLSREAAGALAALTGLRQLRHSGGFGQQEATALPALSRLQALTVQHWTLHVFFEQTAPHLSRQLTSL